MPWQPTVRPAVQKRKAARPMDAAPLAEPKPGRSAVHICSPELVSHTPKPHTSQIATSDGNILGCGVIYGANTHPAVRLELRELRRFEATLTVSSYSRQHVAPHQERAHRRRLLPYHRRGKPCAARSPTPPRIQPSVPESAPTGLRRGG